MSQYLPEIVGLAVGIFLGALIAVYVTRWLAGFKPRYSRALLSTFIAYVAVYVLGFALASLGAFEHSRSGLGLMGWGALTCSHISLIGSDSGQELSAGKAMLLSILQIFGTMIGSIPVVLIIALILRVLGWTDIAFALTPSRQPATVACMASLDLERNGLVPPCCSPHF